MKRIILFVFAYTIFLSSQAQISVTREFRSHDYEIGIITEDFIVLDINYDEQLVAFKHIFKLREVYDEMGETYKQPCNCKYTGLEDKPYTAAVLGVYDLKEQKYLKTFTVYKAAYEEKDCSPYELSVKMLDSAKTFFIEHKLDINHKPIPETLNVSGDSISQFTYKNVNFRYSNNWELDWDLGIMNTKSQLYIINSESEEKEEVLYVINQEDYYYMASGGRIDYLNVYESEGKVVFLNCFFHYNHMSGGTDSEVYHFSPIFNLSDFTKK